jgi:precorrin-2 dehydrogenase/sirohydrochlorin ferrochelatase
MAGRNESFERAVFPVCLLLQGRPALVVGGGRVAAHKVRLLLDGGASVTVVSPVLGEGLRERVAEGKLHHLPRPFADDDVAGASVVFAATDDRDVNRRVLEVCRARRILCCSADGNWTDGDFVTPATLRQDGLTVAVSTGGRSCRRARLVRESLSRHLDAASGADLLVLGTSHEHLPLARREPYHLAGRRLEAMGRMVAQVWGVHEFMLLNTCNRVELHAIVNDAARVAPVLARLLDLDHLAPGEHYAKHGFDAFAHLAAVSAGLHSQTPGEYHIVAQVKEALARGTEAGWSRAMMQEWVAHALHVSKDIRAATPQLPAIETEDVCVQYLEAVCPPLAARRPLVLGAGTVGLGVVERLLRHVSGVDLCYHLRRPELPAAWRDRVRLWTFDDLKARLALADVVVCATDSPHYVLLPEHGLCLDAARPAWIVDLTTPRNVDPALAGARPSVQVADLETLKAWHGVQHIDRAALSELASRTVAGHAELYAKLRASFRGSTQAA